MEEERQLPGKIRQCYLEGYICSSKNIPAGENSLMDYAQARAKRSRNCTPDHIHAINQLKVLLAPHS